MMHACLVCVAASILSSESALRKRQISGLQTIWRDGACGPYTRPSDDPHFRHNFGWVAGACFWKLSERVPKPVARERERSEAAIPLPELRAHAGLVGERAGRELGGVAGAMQVLQSWDWVAVSGGGTGGRHTLEHARLASDRR